MKYALVADGIVVNVILWDGQSEYTPPGGAQTVPYASGCVIGGTYTEQDGFGPIPE